MKRNLIPFPTARLKPRYKIGGHLITMHLEGKTGHCVCLSGSVQHVSALEASVVAAKWGIFPNRAGRAGGAV